MQNSITFSLTEIVYPSHLRVSLEHFTWEQLFADRAKLQILFLIIRKYMSSAAQLVMEREQKNFQLFWLYLFFFLLFITFLTFE